VLKRFQPQLRTLQEAVAYHCFRGLLMPDTAVLLSTAQHPAEACMAQGAQRAADQHIVPEVARLALSDAQPSGAVASPGRDDDGGSSGSTQSTAGGRLLLVNRQPRTSREPSASTVHVHTNDGEVTSCNRQQTLLHLAAWQPAQPTVIPTMSVSACCFARLQMFPVKRKLLRSCIALTPVVRSNEQQLISVQVDVDTLTFDR
jgi:hypothetical protein